MLKEMENKTSSSKSGYVSISIPGPIPAIVDWTKKHIEITAYPKNHCSFILTMETIKINLTIEKGEDHILWGGLTYNDNLITDYAEHIPELETKLKSLLEDFEGIAPQQIK